MGRGFRAVPRALECENQVMTVTVEGRKPQCWTCKQLGHFSRSCPQKNSKPTSLPLKAASAAATTVAATAGPTMEAEDHPSRGEEGWTQVTRGQKKKSPLKAPINEATTVSPEKKSTEKPTSSLKITSQKKKEEKTHQPTEKPVKHGHFF